MNKICRNNLELILFTTDVDLAIEAEKAGIDRICIDFEYRDKESRQKGYNLECNKCSIKDLIKIRDKVSSKIICRINPFNKDTKNEIDKIISAGADSIMLPSFNSVDEVKKFIDLVDSRVETILLFERKKSFENLYDYKELNFNEFYIGFNDLAIDYKYDFCYKILNNDIMNKISDIFDGKNFGFGGITILDGGFPLDVKSIIKELCFFKGNLIILRRAFKRDVKSLDMKNEVEKIKKYYAEQLRRKYKKAKQEHLYITEKINRIEITKK